MSQLGPITPSTPRYALQDAAGLWLHFSLKSTTGNRAWRWEGTLAQLDAVRTRHPETNRMRPVKIVATMLYSKER